MGFNLGFKGLMSIYCDAWVLLCRYCQATAFLLVMIYYKEKWIYMKELRHFVFVFPYTGSKFFVGGW